MEQKLQRLMTQFNFAPVREVHKGLLEGKGRQTIKPAFQRSEAVEQVAG